MKTIKETIVLGGGCFWCLEAVYKRVSGVVSVQSGYSGGNMENPDYNAVCTGETGHAEVVKIIFNPDIIPLDSLLDIFWQAHNPVTKNRQGNDIGTQYRSVIFYTSEKQKSIIAGSVRKLEESGKYSKPVVTEIMPLENFWPAENYHNNYYELHKNQPYCKVVIEPKLKKLFKTGN